MSNSTLNNSVNGRLSIRDVFRWAAEWRDSRRLRRAWNKFYRNWFFGDHADQHSQGFGAIVAELNAAHDLDQQAFRALGARYGAFPESVQDEVYYVDADNGSDVSGNGTFDSPYASLWFLPYFLPKRIDHHYRVVIMSDLTEEVLYLNTEFGPFGSIAFVGRGTPVVDQIKLIGANQDAYAGLHAVDMTVGGMSDDQFANYFLRHDAGGLINEAHAIFWHDANADFRTPRPWQGSLLQNDQVSICHPRVTLTIAGISISCNSPKLAVEDNGATIGSRIGFFNLDIDVRNTAKEIALNLETGTGAMMSFCRIIYDDAVQIPVKVNGSELNHEAFIDDDVDDYAQCDIRNLITDPLVFKPAGLILHNPDGFTGSHHVLHIEGNSKVDCVSHRQETLVRMAKLTSQMCAFNSLYIDDSIMWAQYLGIGWIDGSRSINIESGDLRVATISTFTPLGGFGCNGDIIQMGGSGSLPGRCGLYINTHDDANSPVGWTDAGVNVFSPSTLFFSSTPAALIGATDHVLFSTAAAPLSQLWPAAGASVDDGLVTATASVHA